VSASVEFEMYNSFLKDPSGHRSIRPPGSSIITFDLPEQLSIALQMAGLAFSKLFGFTPKAEREIILCP